MKEDEAGHGCRRGSCAAPPSVIVYTSAALITFAVLFVILDLSHLRLDVPYRAFSGDGLIEVMFANSLYADGSWTNVTRMGAPFSHNVYLMPPGSNLDFLLCWAMSTLTGSIGMGLNCSWIIKMILAAMTMTWALRQLRISPWVAIALGVLYGITPYTLERNVQHYNLPTYLVPLMAAMALLILQGKFDGLPRRSKALFLLSCVLAGFNEHYTAYFSCFILLVAGMLTCFSRDWRWRTALIPVVAILLIIGAGFLNSLPTLLAWRANPGAVAAFDESRTLELADTWTLHMRHLLLPVPNHPIPLFKGIYWKVAEAFPHRWGLRTAALGTIGSAGFLILLAVGFIPAVRKSRLASSKSMERLLPAAALTLALIILGVAGGFANLIVLFIVRNLRSYTRVSTFIEFYSLFTVGVLLCAARDRYFKKNTASLAFFHCGLGALLLFGVWDQKGALPSERAIQDAVDSYDEAAGLVAQIEESIPEHAMVYQLPDNDQSHKTNWWYQLRPYLLSKTLRWSYSPLVRTDKVSTWNELLHRNKDADFQEMLLLAGFDGVWIDRWAYEDNGAATVAQYETLPGAKKLESSPGRYVFIDLSATRRRLIKSMGQQAYGQKQASVLAYPLQQYKWGMKLELSEDGNGAVHLKNGWVVGASSSWTWAQDTDDSVMALSVPSGEDPIKLEVLGAPLTTDEYPSQEVMVLANGTEIAHWQMTGNARRTFRTFTAVIPPGTVREDGFLEIVFRVPTATTPASLGINQDEHRLGLSIRTVTLTPRPES